MSLRNRTEVRILLSDLNDLDLIGLYEKIGRQSFMKIARNAILSLKDSSYSNKLDFEQLQLQSKSTVEMTSSEKIIRFHFTGENARFLISLSEKIKPRHFSVFIKNIIRQFIGFENLLPFYLNDTIHFVTKNVTRLEIGGIEESTSKRKTRKKQKTTSTHIRERKIENTTTQTTNDISVETSLEPTKPKTAADIHFTNNNELSNANNTYPSLDFSNMFTENTETVETESSNDDDMTDDDVLAMLTNILS